MWAYDPELVRYTYIFLTYFDIAGSIHIFCVYHVSTHTHTNTHNSAPHLNWVSIKEFLTPTLCKWLLRSKINKYKIGVM